MSNNQPDRPGLYICCMRAAERLRGIAVGDIFQCVTCQQHIIEYGNGAFRVATEQEVAEWEEEKQRP